MKTDRELILSTIEHLRDEDAHINIREYWEGFGLDKETRIRLRKILLKGELINLKDNWHFQLTAFGIISTSSDFDNRGRYKDDKIKIRNVIVTLGIVPVIYYAMEILEKLRGYFCFCNF